MEFRFNLTFNKTMMVFLPEAFVAKKTINDFKLATTDVLKTLGFERLTSPNTLNSLIEICHELHPIQIFNKFNKNKKYKNLEHLLKEELLKKAVVDYCHQKLDSFLNIIKLERFPLYFEVLQNRDFSAKTINRDKIIALEPFFYFENRDENLVYELTLVWENEKKFPSEHQIIILTPQSSWIIFDGKLAEVIDVNAAKLKPFLDKKQLVIEERLKIDYFQKFIKEIIRHAQVETKGFEVEEIESLSKVFIKAIHDFFDDTFYLDLEYNYGDFKFMGSKKNKSHVKIDVIEQKLKVKHYKRNLSEENHYVELLENLGFKKTTNGYWNHEENLNPKSNSAILNLEKLQDHVDIIKESFSKDATVLFNQHRIFLEKPFLNEVVSESIDWFEINFSIQIANFTLKFTNIIEHLRKKQNLFELADGNYFLIPNLWFEKFNNIISVAEIQEGKLKVSKVHKHLIEHFIPEQVQKRNLNLSMEEKHFKGQLRAYQKEGVQWMLELYEEQKGGCLADDMGLGKTIQTLAFLNTVYWNKQNSGKNDYFPNDLFSIKTQSKFALQCLIVLPTTLIHNWYHEIKQFTPHFDVLKYDGKERKSLQNRLLNYDIVLVSYNILSRDISIFEKLNFECVVVDESQHIKNTQSQFYQSIIKLKSLFRLSLTGTPLENSLSELWSQMNFLNPKLLGSKRDFEMKYHFRKKEESVLNLELLKQIIQPFILRRIKKHVLSELPDYAEQVIYSTMDELQAKFYESEKAKIRNQLLKIDLKNSSNNFHVLQSLMRLRQISIHPKLIDKESEIKSTKFDDVTDTLMTLVASKQKTLIFSTFVKNIALYEQWCREKKIKFVSLTGSVESSKRDQIINQFKTDEETFLFFISIKTGGTGLNLTEASFVLILDPWWNPHIEFQAIGRAHRMGQKQKVNVIRFITNDTIESKIQKLQEKKRALFDQVFNDEFIDAENNLLNFLPELI